MAKIYSHSKISCFEQCPFRFKLKYIDKIKPDIEKTIEAHLGSCVHDSLEWLYNQIQNQKSVPLLDETIEFFSTKWQKEMNSKTEIIKPEMTEKDYFNKGVQFLISYYMKNHPFNDGTIECEKKVFLNLDNYGEYKIIGYIDRLAINPETGKYEVHDYKTANNLPDRKAVENDRQLALYSIAIKEQYKIDCSDNIHLIWHYLAHNQKIYSKRTDNQIEQLKKQTLEKIHEIESTEEFPACSSILCNWCEFKNTCKEMHEAESYKKAQEEISEIQYNQRKEGSNEKKELDIW